jgi:Beta-lactamase
MREPQAAIPEPWTSGSHVGLGWMLSDWGRPVFGHDGQTLGQTAYLQVVPGPGPVAVALLTNSGVLALSFGTDRIEAELVPFAPDAYLVQLPGREDWLPVMFYTLGDGTRYLHVGGQAAPRTGLPDNVSECPR